MEYTDKEKVFKYLDGLKKRNTRPDEYLNRVTGKFLVSSGVASSCIADWIDREFETLTTETHERYERRKCELEMMYQEEMADIEARKADFIFNALIEK